ncbi:prenyltransferase [bacterium]|nr:prenyltransferase [bacterium]
MNNDTSFLNIGKWIKERYPVPVMVYAAILFLLCVSATLSVSGLPVVFTTRIWMGTLVAISIFLVMRALDEHKDFKSDSIYHRNRVLQRGLITLTHIKIVAAICLGLQLIYNILSDGGHIGRATFAWIIMLIYLTLMTKEFFIGEWLKRRLFWYSVSHMLIMVFVVGWFSQLAIPNQSLPVTIWPVALLTFLSGFSGEIIRKTWAPEEEREGIDSYAQIFGLKRACILVLALLAGASFILTHLTTLYGHHHYWGYLGIAAAYTIPVISLIRFMARPSTKGRKTNEVSIGLFMLLSYGFLIINLMI